MSSYFVNSLFTKYKSGDTLRPNYYECGFAQDLGTRPTVVYGPGTGATFQHAPQIQEFYHHGASTLSAAPYQQSPCAVTCHGEPGNFYGYDALQRQTLFSAQDADLVQYSDCKLSTGGIGDETDNAEQSPSPTQLFPWMRPQGEPLPVSSFCVCVWKSQKTRVCLTQKRKKEKKNQRSLSLELHFLCAREEGGQ
ncbi:homeobox protein Hox-B8 [Pimephales promelas]|nr:homeobox protein Hox-B8 [Pimephales promelas]